MAGYIGAQPFTKASYDKEVHIATAGQTVFNVVYNVHFLDVLVNGVELNETDYVANNGTTVVFNSPLALNDEVTFKVWGTFNVADTYTQAEIDAKDSLLAPLANPVFTGTPTAPTPTAGDNSTKIATTEFVRNEVTPVVSYLSKSGYNSQAIVVDGDLYTASGSTANYAAYTSGLYSNVPTEYGVLGNFQYVPLPSNSPIKKVGGFMHAYAFALLENGNLYTWGRNSHGQCGLGHTNITPHPTLAATGVIDTYDHPSQGEYTVDENRLFILKSDGLYSAGYNVYGQCGVGNTTANISTFTKCVGLTNTSSADIKSVFAIGAGYGSTWVVTTDNKLWVTGRNNTGNHGDGTTTDKSTFTDVTSHWVTAGKTLDDVKVVGGTRYYTTQDYGSQGTMVILLKYTDGTSEVKSAGYNEFGSLGDGTTTQKTTSVSPIGIPTDGSVVDIQGFSSSNLTVHVLLSNGNVYGWGNNGYGQVGNNTTTNIRTPVQIATGVTKLFSDGMTSHKYGYAAQNFIQKADGLYVNGYNTTAYYTGMGVNVISHVLVPSKVMLPEDDNQVIDIGHFTTTDGRRIILALTYKNNIYAWGNNGQNGLTSDTTTSIAVPRLVQLKRRMK